MADKLPPDWNSGYIPTQSEWQGAFADAITKGSQSAQTAIAPQITALGQSVSANSQAITANSQAIAANTQSIATITPIANAATRSPAVVDQNMNGFKLTGLPLAVFTTDAIRFDQSGLIATGTYSSISTAPIVAVLPQTGDCIRVDLRGVIPLQAAAMYLRVSVDGGMTFLQGASEYNTFIFYASGSTVATYPSAMASFASLTQVMPINFPSSGYIEIDPTMRTFTGRVDSAGNINLFTGYWQTVGTPTHLSIGFAGQSLQAGRAKVSRRIVT